MVHCFSLVQGCPSGMRYSGGSTCTLCPRNTYNDVSDHFLLECMDCPEHFETDNTGSVSLNQCKCK